MVDWPVDSIHWIYCLLAATGISLLALFWLARRTAKGGSVGWIADVIVPLLLAAATTVLLPNIVAAFGVAGANFQAALERLLFRAVWIGVLFDQSSWVQRTTVGLRGRRAGWPTWLWGGGFLVLMLAPLASRWQNSILAWLEPTLADPAFQRDLNADPTQWNGLVSDWGLRVAEFGLVLTLVGVLALAGQSVIWILRIGHAYLFREADDYEEASDSSVAPGCFQSLTGFLFGAAGVAWLIWTTVPQLQRQ